jgi:hypothetical protein
MQFAGAVVSCRILHHDPLVEREEQLVVRFNPHLWLLWTPFFGLSGLQGRVRERAHASGRGVGAREQALGGGCVLEVRHEADRRDATHAQLRERCAI